MNIWPPKRENVRPREGGLGRRLMAGILTACLLGAGFWAPVAASAREMPTRVGAPRVRPQGSEATPTVTPSPTATLTQAERLTQLMLQIDAAWHASDWPLVLSLIEQVIAIDPTYDDIQNKKYYALLNYGWQLLTQGRCTESLSQFRQALLIKPDGEEARLGLEAVAHYCTIPVPTSTPTPPPGPPPFPTPTPIPQPVSQPFQYVVQKGDTLYSLAKRYGTTVQAIMQINGMMSSALREGETIWIPASGQAPPEPMVHIVQPGETLYSLARMYNTTVWAIMAINNLKAPVIWAYRALFIPSSAQPGPIIHIVQPGETLYSIAQHYAISLPMLMLANHLSTYTVRVYQRLIIPPQGWQGWPPLSVWTGPIPNEPAPCSHGIYIVKAGDTLYSIARRYGVTVSDVMAANHLTSATIYVGAKLCIP
ncbi:MAG: LysM peptidoglycan-binding domain-containing protein [Chloroflexi bacterium]|nr:LysM peptidoglycan-binding domain-containing protein [Chloroflexota bacterium]